MVYKIPLYNEKLQQTGFIDSDGMVLRKFISDPENQRLKFPNPAWCLDIEHLELLEAMGGSEVRITIKGDKTYHASLADFKANGKLVDRGHGVQRGLELEYWKLAESKQATMSL